MSRRRVEVDVAVDGSDGQRGFAALGAGVAKFENQLGSAKRTLRELDGEIVDTKREIFELDKARADPKVGLDDTEYKRKRDELKLSLAQLRQEKLEVNVDYRQLRDANTHTKTLTSSFTDLRTEGNKAGAAITAIGRDAFKLLKAPTMIAALGGAAQGLSAMAAGGVALGSALTPLAGLLGAAPALYGAMGQASGVIALAGVSDLTTAVGGLNTKLDEQSAAFKKLSPAAQDFARQLQQAKAPFRDLQEIAQEGLFSGASDGFAAARKNMGSLDVVVRSTTDSLGGLAAKAGEFLGRKGFGRDFEAIGKTNAGLLTDMGNAGLHFGDALRHVMVAAQPLVRWLGDSAVGFSKWVEEQAKAARQSGDLTKFFGETRDVMERVTSIGGSLANVFWDIGKAAKPLGDEILKSLDQGANDLERWADSTSGKNDIADFFERAHDPIYEAGKLIGDMVDDFFELSQTPGLTDLIHTFRTELLPVLTNVVTSTTAAFGPKMVQLLAEVGKTFATFAGTSGPLVHFVDFLTTGFRVLNKIIDSNEGLKDLLVTFVGIAGVVKAMKFTAAFTGITALTGAFKKLTAAEGAATAASSGAGAAGAVGKASLLSRLAALGGGAGGALLGAAAIPAGMTALVVTLDQLQETPLEQLKKRFEGLNNSINTLDTTAGKESQQYKSLAQNFDAAADSLRDVDVHVANISARGIPTSPMKGVTNEATKQIDALKESYGSLLNAAQHMSKGSRDAFADFAFAAVQAGDITQKQYGRLYDIFRNTEDRAKQTWDRVADVTGEKTKRIANAVGDMTTKISGSYDGMVEATGSGIDILMSNTGRAMKSLGLKQELDWKTSSKNVGVGGIGHSHAQQMGGSTGGTLIPGWGEGDSVMRQMPLVGGVLNKNANNVFFGLQRGGAVPSVPTLLEPGERAFDQWTPTLELMNQLVPRRQKGGGIGGTPAMLGLAKQFEAAHEPYQWGGGHGAFVTSPTPVDCSGFVSAILHAGGLLDGAPMVSGALMGWGNQAKGNEPLVVAAGPGHTVIKLPDGNVYGTSLTNPGGGAGLIEGVTNPASLVSGAAIRTMDVAGAIAAHVSRVLLHGPAGGMRDTGQAGLDKVWRSDNAFLSKQMPSGTFGGGDVGDVPRNLQQYNRTYPNPTSLANPGEAIPAAANEGLLRLAGFGDGKARRSSSAQNLIDMRESGGGGDPHPGIVSFDDGRGTGQMTPSQWDGALRSRIEGLGSYFNPAVNAQMQYMLDTASAGDPWAATAQRGGAIAALSSGGAVSSGSYTPLDHDIKALAGLIKALSKAPVQPLGDGSALFEGTLQGSRAFKPKSPFYKFNPTSFQDQLDALKQERKDFLDQQRQALHELRAIRRSQENIEQKSIAGHLALQAISDTVDDNIGTRGASASQMAGAYTLGTAGGF